jgi:hypothetical protein
LGVGAGYLEEEGGGFSDFEGFMRVSGWYNEAAELRRGNDPNFFWGFFIDSNGLIPFTYIF